MPSLSASIAEQAKTCLYPRLHPEGGEEWQEVARRKNGQRPGFGGRLSHLRKAADYTHQERAQELGVSRRRVAYDAGETERPPAALLPGLAATLGVSTEELLGVANLRATKG